MVLSSDLTAASDLLPLDLISALVEGLISPLEARGLEPFWGEALRVLSGPQNLSWKEGERIWTKRGILMGLPTTWFLLNLVHQFWCHLAVERSEVD